MALYGSNLARSIRPGTTWELATTVLGTLEDGIRECYSSLTLYDNLMAGNGVMDTLNLAWLKLITPDDAQKVKVMLDEELAGLYGYDELVQGLGQSEGWEQELPEDHLELLKSKVETSSSLIALVDSLFHTSVATQVSDAIVPAVGDISDKLANIVSKAVGNFLAGIWWIIALAIVGLYVYRRQVKVRAR